ncbi:MAG: hypothetical protein ACI944_002610, partial [Natronomonas sp.]
MVEFTFIELHFEDSDLTANAPYSRGQKEIDAGGTAAPEESSSKRGTIFAVLVGLCFLIAVAYLVRTRVLGEDDVPGADSDALDADDNALDV